MDSYRERIPNSELRNLLLDNYTIPDGMGWTAYAEAYEVEEALPDILKMRETVQRYIALIDGEPGGVEALVGNPHNAAVAAGVLEGLRARLSELSGQIDELQRRADDSHRFGVLIWQMTDSVVTLGQDKVRLDRLIRYEMAADEDRTEE